MRMGFVSARGRNVGLLIAVGLTAKAFSGISNVREAAMSFGACEPSGVGASPRTPRIVGAPARSGDGKTLNVYAAASLKESFTAIAHRFEAAHPGLKVSLDFAGSQTLAAQIKQGAPADVFASAAEKNLREVEFEASSYRIFARNRLMIAVRRGLSGMGVARDLVRAQRIVVAAPAVPVGGYSEAFLRLAGAAYGSSWLARVRAHVVSQEQDVKAVLAKVALGEADAGVVYASDVKSAHGQVLGVAIPDGLNKIANYPVAVLSHADDPATAREFVKFLFTPEAQRALERDGFMPAKVR